MSIARIATLAAIVAALSAVGATAKPVATTGETNLRQGPGTDSSILTLIPKGTTVEVGTCTKGWCQVSVDGQDGYVIGKNVGMAPARRPPPGPVVAGGPYGPPVVYGPPPVVVGPPVYYGYGPYYGYRPYYRPYWGFRGGWRRW